MTRLVLFADVIIIGLLAKERRGAAEVNAHRQEDGEIEHTQKKHMKITHRCEKDCFALCDSKKSAMRQK